MSEVLFNTLSQSGHVMLSLKRILENATDEPERIILYMAVCVYLASNVSISISTCDFRVCIIIVLSYIGQDLVLQCLLM